MPSVGALPEVAMSCARLLVISAALSALVLLAVPDGAFAQAGCQPTMMQPCTKVPPRANAAPPGQKNAVRADDDDDREPKDRSPRIKIDGETEFKFGTGGIGLGRKF
jgi:hypothetical protein